MQGFYWHGLGEEEARQKETFNKEKHKYLFKNTARKRTLLVWLSSSPESVCCDIYC